MQAGAALTGGDTGDRFAFVQPNQPPANPERLVQVAHRPALNPGAGTSRSRSGCAPPTPSACDYFAGDLDYLKIETS